MVEWPVDGRIKTNKSLGEWGEGVGGCNCMGGGNNENAHKCIIIGFALRVGRCGGRLLDFVHTCWIHTHTPLDVVANTGMHTHTHTHSLAYYAVRSDN